jgi:hypothetical protein
VLRRLALAAPLVFVIMGWPALRENSGTYDEPFLLSAGWTYWTRGDFRLNPEHPPLVKELLALPLVPLGPVVSPSAERAFAAAVEHPEVQFLFGDRLFNRDNAPQPLLARARVVAAAFGAALVLVVTLWAGAAFGSVAAVVAGVLAALDPNLLAHGTVATTDLGFALFFTAALFALRQAFVRARAGTVLGAGVLLGAAFASKHTAMLLAPIVLAWAVVRLLDATPWPVGGRMLRTTGARATALVVVLLCWTTLTWASIWAVYGFRWSAAPDGPPLPLAEWVERIPLERALAAALARGEPVPDDETLARAAAAERPTVADRLVAATARHHLLPEAYVFGLTVATALGQIRNTYLLGHVSLTGSPWYFPFAVLVKTPVGTLLAAIAATALAHRRRDVLLVALAATILLGGAMTSNLNIGYRHVLPLVPLLCVLAGAGVAGLESRAGPRAAVVASAVLCLAVAAESIAARPAFLPFFNVAATAAREKIDLLSDSNLDWGQGLPALRRWMAAHQVPRVSLAYFGSMDPRRYGIDFVPLAGTNFGDFGDLGTLGYRPEPPVVPGWVAVSATHLQGTYLPPELRDAYAFLRRKTPAAVPADAIYVYWVDRWGE